MQTLCASCGASALSRPLCCARCRVCFRCEPAWCDRDCREPQSIVCSFRKNECLRGPCSVLGPALGSRCDSDRDTPCPLGAESLVGTHDERPRFSCHSQVWVLPGQSGGQGQAGSGGSCLTVGVRKACWKAQAPRVPWGRASRCSGLSLEGAWGRGE